MMLNWIYRRRFGGDCCFNVEKGEILTYFLGQIIKRNGGYWRGDALDWGLNGKEYGT